MADGTSSTEAAMSEMPMSEVGEATPGPAGFPPYPPYATEPAPPSVADTIFAGRDLRLQHKSTPRKPVRPPPKPARPRGPKATDVKMSKRAARAHARCLRRHGAVLTDRLERISKPQRRHIIYLWREHAHTLQADTIARLRAMLDADEPFKPDQAYEYFVNLRKTKKKATKMHVNQIKKDVLAVCGDKRFVWARNATVAFARGIQQRLSRPGSYALADGMLRLSNIILEDLCGVMHMKTPSRRWTYPKARFMMEMADKIAVWIDEVITESDDRMLMMDFDEDDDLAEVDVLGDAGFTDDFLNMMAGGGLLKGPQPAYLKFTGEMLEAFMILTDSMNKKGDAQLLSHGKFTQTYSEGVDELKQATDFTATEFNTTIANQLEKELANTAKPNTPKNIEPYMTEMVDICGKYLAQNAEFNKDKGPGFKLLVKTMRTKPNEQLYQKEKANRTYARAATELEDARGLDSDHDDPNLSQDIHSNLSKLVDNITPNELKQDMTETLDVCSKYLSQCAVDEIERGPAFDILVKELERNGGEPFTPEFPVVESKFVAAYVLKSAPGLSNITPDANTSPTFVEALHKAVDVVTPKALVNDMAQVIDRCANYLSAFVRDRDKALQTLLKMMKSNPNKEVATRNDYTMTYGTGAMETETAPVIVPYMPIKDIADEAKEKLTKDMENATPPDLKTAMKSMVQDVARYLSQGVALRSGVAGERYPLNFLAAVKKSLGTRPLFKYKAYGQNYSDGAEVLKYAGPLESDPKNENLRHEISTELKQGVPVRLAPTLASGLDDTIVDASKHLAKVGTEKGEALQHLVDVMKEEGDAPLGNMQGYQQTYNDGARRIENSTTLTNDKVDKGTYESIRGKLTALVEKKPAPEHAKHLPGIVDESSKFLSAPFPESDLEKRQVLSDLMARKGDEILGQEGLYKMTFTEGGQEIIKAPVGVTTAKDEGAKKEILDKVNSVIPPDKKLQEVLKGPANEGSAHLADVIKGRGEVMKVLHDEMRKSSEKDFLTVGKFKKNHGEAAEMLESAHHFGGQKPSPVLVDKVADKVKDLSTTSVSTNGKRHIKDTSDITVNYIAGVATSTCGLDAKALAALEGAPPKARSVQAVASTAPTSSKEKEEKKASVTGFAPTDNEDERRRFEEVKRRKSEADKKRKPSISGGTVIDTDPERDQAMQILHGQLRARGGEVFYKQPHTELTHSKASEWLSMKPPMKVDKSVKESGDTARLHKKFERKLSALVSKKTPIDMRDTMQDVVIESSRILSEYFVSKSYKALVREALISEMQRRGNEILIEVDGAAETFFFAAQRLKKAKSLDVKEPCTQVSYSLMKKLEDMIRCRSMARKLTTAMKDHIKEAADYLSELVTKPDEQIEAYVSLLGEMETAGDSLLIEGNIPKSYKDAAAYLRQLTSFEDQIRRPDSTLQSSIEGKLKNLMANVAARGYTKAILDKVISESAKLLVSYIMLQGEKTEALKILIKRMEDHGGNVLLRHGTIRKTYADGANILQANNTDQLRVSSADPVVARKIEIKLFNLMSRCPPEKHQALMDDVIEDATMYLAVRFLQPQVIQVCKCMKNVFVQCELWCDEILRRVARPCCTCSRHVSAQALADLAPAHQLRISPGSSRAFAPGLDISLTQCPTRQARRRDRSTPQPCPASKPTPECSNPTTSYLLYSTRYQRDPSSSIPTKLSPKTQSEGLRMSPPRSTSITNKSPSITPTPMFGKVHSENIQFVHSLEPAPSPQRESQDTVTSSPSFYTPQSANSGTSPPTDSKSPYWQSPTTMFAKVDTQNTHEQPVASPRSISTDSPRRRTQIRRGYSSRAPIVTTDEMADWHAMMVSLMWNVQAWRDWIQENIDRALAFRHDSDVSSAGEEENWSTFQRRVATEALQWRQYNIFSRQLTLRLALRYRDKQIVSPTRATVKTEVYMQCQREMLEIIDMFNRWTKWLTVVVKEADSLQRKDSNVPMFELRWTHFKMKVEEYLDDWVKYNTHLNVCWEHKYRELIAEWLPAWRRAGPVWVVSACGAVPSGAVAAGVHDGEVTWVARTTHRCNVLPAALHPSKHCCLVYADGAVHHYTKYQVMCNAEVTWTAWRAGAVGARAVRVAGGVYVGRVHYRGAHLLGAVHAPHYRCHVVIFGRPFAFNCYELLVLSVSDDV
ncbi:uncharacterized protein [Epargyreus clarus]|uniref:uncharacterized protein n=1 Tax=Epargyreus clarus TaxID=520877 RepID=UPI003C2B50A8